MSALPLPPGITVGPGRKITVTERGYFAPPFTACRFAVQDQINERMGYRTVMIRTRPAPGQPENTVRQLQLLGDPTPQNGSTLKQGQKGERLLLPDSPMLWGVVSDDELLSLVAKNATVGFALNMGKMPRYLKRFCGFGYNGGHYMAIDGVEDGLDVMVDLSDPMYRPAYRAKPQTVPFSDVSPAIIRDKTGNAIVTVGFQDHAWLNSQAEDLSVQIDSLTGQIDPLQAQYEAIKAQLAELHL